MKHLSKTLWILIFAIAMGYLESAVVVYLREIYYPEGFNFPLKAMTQTIAVTELFREAATVIMILAVSIFAAEFWLHRFAWFLVVFSVWDITYYVFLKVILGWPESIFTTDILFLLPSIWCGPVIAPLINSLTMILVAFVILFKRKGSMALSRLSGVIWILLILGSLIVLIAYMQDFVVYTIDFRHSHPSGTIRNDQNLLSLSTQFVPQYFDWLLFCTGVCMHLAAVYLMIKTRRKNSLNMDILPKL
jgi:hypothetical protein